MRQNRPDRYRRFSGHRGRAESIEHHIMILGSEEGSASDHQYKSPYYTEINDQGNTGLCWAFGNVSALEGCLNKKYGTGHELSWKNLAYYAWHKSDISGSEDIKDYNEQVFKQETFNEGPIEEEEYGWSYGSYNIVNCVGNDSAYLFAGGSTYEDGVLACAFG